MVHVNPVDRANPEDTLSVFHPAVATWFERRFSDGPSEPQALGWPEIRTGRNTLIAAPTGSGKTLAGFLVAIDSVYRTFESTGEVPAGVKVVYVSPLKALAVDIHQNLERPLSEIEAVARELGLPVPEISVAVRTGDTPASARTLMTKHPPTFLVTTPESLYLLLTAERSRAVLKSVETVIVDEIHALARTTRGSHLALSLERLDAVQSGSLPQRVGLSATQRPIEMTAVIFNVTGVTSKGSAAACKTDLSTVQSASDAYYTTTGSTRSPRLAPRRATTATIASPTSFLRTSTPGRARPSRLSSSGTISNSPCA